MIKGSIQDDIIVNIYAPNMEEPQYIWQMLTTIKTKTDINAIIVWDFNTPFSPRDRYTDKLLIREHKT